MGERVFLAFTDMTPSEGAQFLRSHKDEIYAAGAGLGLVAQFQDDKTILRLTLPTSMEKVAAHSIFPEFVWMPVQGQVVQVLHTDNDVDIDDVEGGA